MTIFIAGQGIFIFILYVPLSSHVRKHITCTCNYNCHYEVVCIITSSQRRLDYVYFTTHIVVHIHVCIPVGQGSVWEMVEEEASQLFSAEQNNIPYIK